MGWQWVAARVVMTTSHDFDDWSLRVMTKSMTRTTKSVLYSTHRLISGATLTIEETYDKN